MRSSVAVRMAAVIGFLFSAVSIVAGTRVLAGFDRPDYVVLPWLVMYNVAAGIVGVVAGVGLWWLERWAVRLAGTLATAHGAVLVALIGLRATGRAVATDSLVAMLLRTVVWALIALVAVRFSARHITRGARHA